MSIFAHPKCIKEDNGDVYIVIFFGHTPCFFIQESGNLSKLIDQILSSQYELNNLLKILLVIIATQIDAKNTLLYSLGPELEC